MVGARSRGTEDGGPAVARGAGGLESGKFPYRFHPYVHSTMRARPDYRIWWEDRLRHGTGMRLFEMGLQLHLRAEPKRGRPGTGLFELGLQLHLRAEPKRGRAGTGLFELVNYRIWWEDWLRHAGTRLFKMLRAEPKRRPCTGLFELGLQLHLWAEPKGDRPSKGLFELGLQLYLWAKPKREAKQIEAADCSRTKSENEGKNERSVQKQESIRSKNKGV
uniref:Uncharacterized protein n=1 Tax=Oryza nivara TaxID=4536 RepID=A0A0E0J7C7_ORYNI